MEYEIIGELERVNDLIKDFALRMRLLVVWKKKKGIRLGGCPKRKTKT